MENATDTAVLSSSGSMTSFSFRDRRIRFRTPSSLQRYTQVKEWDNGYLVLGAQYHGHPEIEEYIDLLPILRNLYIDPSSFLAPIKRVVIRYE